MGTQQRLLVVDDDPGIRAVVRAYASREGFEVEEAADGERADRRVAEQPPVDLVVLDLMIPGIDGWELCQRWRGAGGPPVIMLTARATESERVLGLGLGADDYVVKPFSPLELMARVKAVLRRSEGAPPRRTEPPAASVLTRGNLTVDLETRRAQCGERPVAVTRRQFDLLAALAMAGERVSSRLDLLRVLGDGEVAATDRAVDQHVVTLRRALRDAGCRCEIATVRGIGYRLEGGA